MPARLFNMVIIPPLLFFLLFSVQAHATTWSDELEKDPVTGKGECIGKSIMSFGGYIYGWPSKYDMVFWPMTDIGMIWYCPDSGYASFGGDFNNLSGSEKEELKEWLSENYKKGSDPAKQLQSFDWLEKVYSKRNMTEDWWNMFFRIQIYDKAESEDMNASMEYLKKALPLIEKQISAKPDGFELIETYFLLGEYNRRLGHKEKAEKYFGLALNAEYEDEEGNKKTNHPYISELVKDSRQLIDRPGVHPLTFLREKAARAKAEREQDCSAKAKSNLANLAILQEAYYTDNNEYTNSIEKLKEIGFEDDLADDVNLQLLKGDKELFRASASTNGCDKDNDGKDDVYYWDSSEGGLQR